MQTFKRMAGELKGLPWLCISQQCSSTLQSLSLPHCMTSRLPFLDQALPSKPCRAIYRAKAVSLHSAWRRLQADDQNCWPSHSYQLLTVCGF